MKYLKLFEAFESKILSKTLKYLSKSSKENFLDHVKKICDELDFPYSQLKDDYFEYTSFAKAFDKVENNDKIYKFWLDTSGNLVKTSLTDGNEVRGKGRHIEDKKFDSLYDFKKYVEDGGINHKDKILIEFEGRLSAGKVPATLWREDYRGRLYAIFSSDDCDLDGSQPDGDDWEEYGNSSWSLGDDDWTIWTLKDLEDGEKLLNKRLDSKKGFIKSDLSDSQFAIVFNSSKLDTLKKRSSIKVNREEMRSGAEALKKPEDIKKSNIERRLMEIAKKEFNINTFNELFNKVLFDKNILFFDINTTLKNIDRIIKLWEGTDLIDHNISGDGPYMTKLKKWHSTLNGDFKSEVNSYFSKMMNQIKKEDNKLSDDPIRNEASRLTLIKFGIEDENVSTIPNSIFQILKSVYNSKTDLLSREATKKPNCKLLSNKLIELGQLIINKVKPSTFEDIDDIVIAEEKLKSISRILLSDRYEFKKSHVGIMYWSKGLSSDDIDKNLLDKYIDILNQMIKLVNKL
jgi:hypothetical protein